MPGHGRPIAGVEEAGRSGRSVLPVALTSRLHTSALRQMFTSLRPLVTHSRQRTLSTYARRLHQRQLSVHPTRQDEEDVGPGEEAQGQAWQSRLTLPLPQQHGEATRGTTVINMEARAASIQGRSSSNPEGHQQSLHSEQFVSNQPGEGATANTTSTEGPEPHTDSQLTEPLLARASPTSTALVEDGSGSESGSNEEGTPASNRSASESLTDLLSQFPEVRSGLVVVWHYCIFLFILLAKAVFDHFTGLMIVLTLAAGFLWSNNIVKKAVAQQGRRPVKPLVALLVNLPAAVFFLFYYYRNDYLFYSLLLIPPHHDESGVLDLMWVVIVCDYVLKLLTVLLKTVIALLPHTIMHYHNRGKYFLVVEMGSQLYRCLAPVQPWLAYLLDSYAGPRKVLGVLLSAAYMVCKGPDIVTRLKCFQGAIIKFINSVNYGCTPSKSQLEDAGGLCPICHDDYVLPTMLSCKHIFCEQCVVTWFDRERTCPMCRTQVADDPAWRDGSTTHFVQLY